MSQQLTAHGSLTKRKRKMLNSRNTNKGTPGCKSVVRCPECIPEASGYSPKCDLFISPGVKRAVCRNNHSFDVR